MSDNKIILKAEDLDGYLTQEDMDDLNTLDKMFKETMKSFEPVNEEKIVEGYDKMGKEMQKICSKHPNIKVYSFETEEGAHAEASHVIPKLRELRLNAIYVFQFSKFINFVSGTRRIAYKNFFLLFFPFFQIILTRFGIPFHIRQINNRE